MIARALTAAVVALVALALAARPAAADSREEAERFYRLAEKAYRNQNYDSAAENFDEAYARLQLPDIAFAAAQAHRLQYYVDRKPARVSRAVELYGFYVTSVKEGNRVGDAAASLAEMEAVLRDLADGGARTAAPGRRTAIAISPEISGPARATLDGVEVPTLRKIELEPGEHVLRVEADGYFPAEKTLTAIEGEYSAIEVELRARPAKIEIRTEAGARISVDGRTIGKAPRGVFEVPAGRHQLGVTRRGRAAWTRDLEVGRAQTLTLEAELEPSGRRRVFRWLVIGGSITLVAAVTTGAITGFAISEGEDLKDKRMTEGLTAGELDRYNTLRDRASFYGDATAVLGTVTVAAGITALALYWFDTPTLAQPAVVPLATPEGGGLAISGRF